MAAFIQLRRDQSEATEVSELLQYIDTLRAAYELGVRIRAKMQKSFVTNANAELINWAELETRWGVPVNADNGGTPSVGTGSNGKRVFTFVDGSIGGMEGLYQTADAKNLTETVG